MAFNFHNAEHLQFSFARRSFVDSLPDMRLPYLDLTYCIEGTMEYLINGEYVILEAGDAILFPVGSVRYRGFTDIPNYYASFNIQFADHFEPPICGKVSDCIFSDTITMLENYKKSFETVSMFRQEKCTSIFAYLYHQVLETALDKENRHVKRIKQYIMSNLSHELTLQQLAENVHLEPHYLCTLFKKETGITIMQYLIEQRIDLAKRLIITKDDKLYTISKQCGFDNYNYFSYTFKSVVGISAVQYRKQKSENF